MRDDKLNFSKKGRGKVWKEHTERIMNKKNDWNQNVKAELVEGPVERVIREEVVKTIWEMKEGKVAGPSEVSVEMITACGEIGIGVMVELHVSEYVEQCLILVMPLDGLGGSPATTSYDKPRHRYEDTEDLVRNLKCSF